jgi:hypothetical protein
LGSAEIYKDAFDLSQFSGGVIRAAIQSQNDALALDDVAFDYLPVQRKMRTLLVTRSHGFLETLLKLDDHVDLSVTDPAGFHESSAVDAYIFDRFAPAVAPARPALVIGAPTAPWLKNPAGAVQHPQVTAWSAEHPVAQYVSLQDVSIERAARIDAGNLTVIAGAKETPLIVASENPKWILTTFDLEASDFPFHVAFPIFMENVLAWFAGEPLALKRNPGTIDLSLANAQVRAMDGSVVPSDEQLGKTVFEAKGPGIYTAVKGDQHLNVAVNITNPAVSDVNRSLFKSETPSTSPHYRLHRELWFYMLAAACLLIAVEWYTYHRRMTL